MGEVHHARHMRLGRDVAIKVLHGVRVARAGVRGPRRGGRARQSEHVIAWPAWRPRWAAFMRQIGLDACGPPHVQGRALKGKKINDAAAGDRCSPPLGQVQ